jgi:phosphatidylserine decarboxylase
MPTYSPVVQRLVDYFTENPDFKEAFEDSFALARATGLEEFDELKIHKVDDYIRYMEEYLNWVPFENGSKAESKSGDNVYIHICMFYFILDMPPVVNFQSPIDPSTKSPYRWLSEWLIDYAKDMGKWMDKPESFNKEALKTFYDSPNYHMEEYIEEDWKTFNEFFARRIKPELRPLAGEGDPRVIVTPADSKYDGCWPVNEPEATVTTFDVKNVPWHISQLLYDEETKTDWGRLFAGGVFTHSFLAPDNYHRQHSPVSGRIVEAKVIPGVCYLEVVIKDDGKNKRSGGRLGMHRGMHPKTDTKLSGPIVPIDAPNTPGMEAPDTPGYQFLQARGLVLIESEIGLVAVLPIGMAQVSSVVLADNIKPGNWVNKGDEISKFQLGGSDIVMVFQKDAKVQLPGKDKINQPFKVRSEFGTATPHKNIEH